MNNGLGPWSQVGKSKNLRKKSVSKLCQKLLNNFKLQIIIKVSGVNGYFAGKNLKKLRLRERKFTHIFMGGGGKNSTFSKNILPCTCTKE